MRRPKVTVLMPVYNGECHLRAAIDSILRQSFTDYEFLIIDDGSTDSTPETLASYSDARIRIVRNPKNMGLIATLNKGLDLAQGELIARMDSDDMSLPARLQTQVRFMDGNPHIGLCGSWFATIGGTRRTVRPMTAPGEVKSALLFNSPFAHPTMVMRREVMKKYNLHYSADFVHAEDYELWSRAANYTQMANVPKALLRYREHPSQVSNLHSSVQQEVADRVRISLARMLIPEMSEKEKAIHCAISRFRASGFYSWHRDAEQWLQKLIDANRDKDIYPVAAFSRVIGAQWYRLCVQEAHVDTRLLPVYWQSSLASLRQIGILRCARLLFEGSVGALMTAKAMS